MERQSEVRVERGQVYIRVPTNRQHENSLADSAWIFSGLDPRRIGYIKEGGHCTLSFATLPQGTMLEIFCAEGTLPIFRGT